MNIKNLRPAFLAALSICVFVSSCYAGTLKELSAFASKPTYDNYLALRGAVINKKASYAQEVYSIKNGQDFMKFYRLVVGGNIYAADIAFLLYPYSDGGYTDDLNSAIGEFSIVQTYSFLNLIKKHHISRELMGEMSLGIDWDNPRAEDFNYLLQRERSRLSHLELINDPAVAEYKKIEMQNSKRCIKYLEKATDNDHSR